MPVYPCQVVLCLAKALNVWSAAAVDCSQTINYSCYTCCQCCQCCKSIKAQLQCSACQHYHTHPASCMHRQCPRRRCTACVHSAQHQHIQRACETTSKLGTRATQRSLDMPAITVASLGLHGCHFSDAKRFMNTANHRLQDTAANSHTVHWLHPSMQIAQICTH